MSSKLWTCLLLAAFFAISSGESTKSEKQDSEVLGTDHGHFGHNHHYHNHKPLVIEGHHEYHHHHKIPVIKPIVEKIPVIKHVPVYKHIYVPIHVPVAKHFSFSIQKHFPFFRFHHGYSPVHHHFGHGHHGHHGFF